MRSLKPACILVLLSAASVFAQPQPAAEVTAPPPAATAEPRVLAARVTGKLTYAEQVAPEPSDGGGGGGLAGRINDIAGQIGGAGAGAAQVEASQELTIEAYLKERSDAPWAVTFKAVSQGAKIPPQIKPDVRAVLERESRALLASLNEYSLDLSDAQVLELKLKGETTLEPGKPFGILNTWKGSPPTVTLRRTLGPEVVRMRFLLVGPAGLRAAPSVPMASPVVLEVLFNRAPESGEHAVEIDAGGRVLKLLAQRVDDNPVRFMTPAFVVWADSMGLPPEAPRLPSTRGAP